MHENHMNFAKSIPTLFHLLDMDRTQAYEYVHYFKMADRRGLTFLTMFSTANCKVTAANNTLPVFKDGFTYCTPNFRGWIRAVQKIWLSRTR